MNMRQITERLPAPQYDNEKVLKRSNSLPHTTDRLLASSDPKKILTTESLSTQSSPNLSKATPTKLKSLANKAKRNNDLEVIVEKVGSGEEETLRANQRLYRSP